MPKSGYSAGPTLDNLVYPKPKRFPTGNIPATKEPMSEEDMRYLLSGMVIVEEKMDGTLTKFVSRDPPLAIFAEDLKRMHSIFYHVPGRYAVFDIFDDRRGVFVYPDEKLQLSKELRCGKIKIIGIDGNAFFPIPRITWGKFSLNELVEFVGLSAYARHSDDIQRGVPGEGIVVKQYADSFPEEYVAGKIIRAEFFESITENYLRLPYRANAIDPRVEVVTEPLVAPKPPSKNVQ